jgi:hypothetical protein
MESKPLAPHRGLFSFDETANKLSVFYPFGIQYLNVVNYGQGCSNGNLSE